MAAAAGTVLDDQRVERVRGAALGEPTTSSMSSGANSTTGSACARADGAAGTPLTRMRFRARRRPTAREHDLDRWPRPSCARLERPPPAGRSRRPSRSARRPRSARCERPVPSTTSASSRLVLPAALGPTTTWGPAEIDLQRRVAAEVVSESRSTRIASGRAGVARASWLRRACARA